MVFSIAVVTLDVTFWCDRYVNSSEVICGFAIKAGMLRFWFVRLHFFHSEFSFQITGMQILSFTAVVQISSKACWACLVLLVNQA